MNRKKRISAILVFMLSHFFVLRTWGEVLEQAGKYKAVFVYHFIKYIEWPESYNPNEFIIVMLGDDKGLTIELKSIADNRKIANKPIKLEKYSSPNSIGNCNVLIICSDNPSVIDVVMENLGNKNVLVVSDIPEGISMGSAINFVLNERKLGFEIKPANAQQKGLKISAALNSLAVKKY